MDDIDTIGLAVLIVAIAALFIAAWLQKRSGPPA